MANYQPPTEIDAIFDPTKFESISLAAQGGTDAEIAQALQDLTTKVTLIETKINVFGPIIYTPGNFFTNNCRACAGGSVISLAFTGFVSGATYFIDFQLGFMSAGFTNTADFQYGFNGSNLGGAGNFWFIGNEAGGGGNSVRGNVLASAYTNTNLICQSFIEAHASTIFPASADGTIYVGFCLNLVNKTNTGTVAGTYSVNSNPSALPGSAFTSPYLNLANNACKFVRIN